MAVPVTIWIMVMANTRAGILLVNGHTVGATGAICEQGHAPPVATVHGAHRACRGPPRQPAAPRAARGRPPADRFAAKSCIAP